MDGKGGLYHGEEEDRMKTVGNLCMHDIIVHGGVFVALSTILSKFFAPAFGYAGTSVRCNG